MTFSKTTEYVIRILTYMAFCDKELFSARYLHSKLDIPYKYLTNLLHRLSEYGFLLSVQGKYGGFKFLRNPRDINIYDLVVAFDSDSLFTSCILGLQNCSDDNPCVLHNEWSKIKEQSIELFKHTTLYDLQKNSDMRITDINMNKTLSMKQSDHIASKTLDELKRGD